MKCDAKTANEIIEPKNNPIDLADTTQYKTWMYIEERKILVVHEIRDAQGNYIRTDSIKIPKRLLFS